jgi:hypothetical protein
MATSPNMNEVCRTLSGLSESMITVTHAYLLCPYYARRQGILTSDRTLFPKNRHPVKTTAKNRRLLQVTIPWLKPWNAAGMKGMPA